MQYNCSTYEISRQVGKIHCKEMEVMYAQADKNLGKRVYTLQSGTAIVTHSRSKIERRFARVSRFFALSFHFLSVKTAKTPSYEC